VRIGNAEAGPGERAFGYIDVGHTTSYIPIHIPVNILRGPVNGPTLLVDAALHGPEIIGTLGIGKLLRELDVSDIRGTLIAVPVVNTSAFEWGQRETRWDGMDINRQGKGRPDGTITQRLAHAFFTECMSRADAIVDIHSGGPDFYVHYTIYMGNAEGVSPGTIAKSREMALAFGLQNIFGRTPWRGTLKEEALRAGIPSITPEIGGGADFLHNGSRQIEMCAQGIKNVMIHLGMLDGEIITEADTAIIWDGQTEIDAGARCGMFVRAARWGDRLKRGDPYGIIYDPYTGEEVDRVEAPADGVVLNSGVAWPVIRPGRWMAILGEKMEEVKLDFGRRWDEP
jgi:predicted deacylase